MENFLYHYKARVVKIVDGDTVYCDVDLGFHFNNKLMLFRLAGVNTPELRGMSREAGLKAKEFVLNKIYNKDVILMTKKDAKEKYGRYLAYIYFKDDDDNWVCINDLLVKDGLAEVYGD